MIDWPIWHASVATNYLLRTPANAKHLMDSIAPVARRPNHGTRRGTRRVKPSWTDAAWNDCLYWQTQDRKTLKRVNALGPGIGKPELLRNNLAGLRSRRIDEEHHLVYAVEPNEITLIFCRFRYE